MKESEVSITLISRCAGCPNRVPREEGEQYPTCPLDAAMGRMGDNPSGRRVVVEVLRNRLYYRSGLMEQIAENGIPVQLAYLDCPRTEYNPGRVMIQCLLKPQ